MTSVRPGPGSLGDGPSGCRHGPVQTSLPDPPGSKGPPDVFVCFFVILFWIFEMLLLFFDFFKFSHYFWFAFFFFSQNFGWDLEILCWKNNEMLGFQGLRSPLNHPQI